MKRTRVLLSIIMVLALMLSACSKTSGDGTGDGSGDVTASNKIIIFQSKVEISDQLEALAKEYQKETGVEVEVWGTTGDDYFQQLKTKLSNNQGPTLFSLAPGSESRQLSAYLEDLKDLSFIDKIASGMADTVDGKLAGIPYTVEGFGLVYNKSLIDASKITDNASLIAMMQDMQSKGITGVGLSQESYFLIGHILNTPFAVQDKPAEFLDKLLKGEAKIADTDAFKQFAEVYDAIRTYSYNPLEVNYDKECGDFATGKTAAIHQGNWCYGMFADYNVDFEMGFMPLPICGNDKLAVSVPAAWYVNSQASDADKLAGKNFLNWLYTSDTGKHYLMDEFGFIPVVDGMENANLDPLSKEVARFTSEGKTMPWPMSDWPAGIVDVHLVPVAEQFFTTGMSTDELLTALDQAFENASK
ncbi:MAG: ABC transporter substrate-binding protein [Lachnospiraceae bacterium]|nr:ABC transporter substrate-binding protein [Lachnospiraceae bacterium]